jgi:DNA polymerase III sliding clamp (beta) subunit (PCNA family)
MMIVLNTPKNGEDVKFTINGSTFVKDLRLVSGIFKSGSDIMVAVADSQVALVANDNTKSLCLLVDAQDVEGEGCFTLDPAVFTGVLNNRGDVAFTLRDSSLKFKALKGRYGGDMSTEPVNSNIVDQLNEVFGVEVKELSIPDTVFSALDKGIKFCNLNDAYAELDTELVRYVIGEGQTIKIVTYDQFHSAILETKVDKKLKKDFKIAVYQSYFSAMNSLAKGQRFNIAINEQYFYVKNDKFFLSLPPIQYNEEEFEGASAAMEDIFAEKRSCSCTMATDSFSKVIDNLCSIYELGSKIEVNIAKDKMKLNLATNYGSMSDTFAISNTKGSGTINIDAPPINDVLGCAPPTDCTFSFIDGKAYLLDFETEDTKVSYMVAVLQ